MSDALEQQLNFTETTKLKTKQTRKALINKEEVID